MTFSLEMMARLSLIVLFLLTSAGTLLAGEAPPPVEPAASARISDARRLLVFHGNVVLPDEVYLAIITLPERSAANSDTVLRVRNQCLAFLWSAGFDLARVEVAVEGNHIRVDIDEGHLEKIIFRGTSSLRTVQALIALNLPKGVFNRPYLERQLARSKHEYGIDVEGWKLVESTKHKKIGPEIEDLEPLIRPSSYPGGPTVSPIKSLGNLISRSLIPPRADYELHIIFRRRAWSPGVGLVASITGPDGLKLGLKYKNEDLLFATDRWVTEGTLGLSTRESLLDQHSYLAIQRAAAAASWFSPPFLGELRPAFVIRGDFTSRQRPDLGLENYRVTRAQAGLALNYDLFVGGNVSLGFGAERDDVFNLEQVDPLAPPKVSPGNSNQPYIDTALQLTFDPDEIRDDRKHEFAMAGRQRLGNGAYAYGLATYRYQYIIPIGWHDIWLTSHGAYVLGKASKIPFFEEQSVGGTYVRGVFGSRFFTRRVVSGGLELRYSLTRDVYKVGAFVDSALFGEISPDRQHDHARVVASAGPSFHVLIAAAFQLDIFYAIGIASHGSNERGFGATLNQAF
ncbi:MAG: hypothetical protein NT056_07780 [Proteobacteria bacterium]|nr:hypothetical protein [Pseudomonadota bacterium]